MTGAKGTLMGKVWSLAFDALLLVLMCLTSAFFGACLGEWLNVPPRPPARRYEFVQPPAVGRGAELQGPPPAGGVWAPE
jgi:hypothetical protein